MPSGIAYDFEIEGFSSNSTGKYAASKILNYYIDEKKENKIVMLQLPLGMINRQAASPDIVSIKDKKTGKEITDGFEFTREVTSVLVEFSSKAGGIEPVALSGFGAKMALGQVPNFFNGLKGYRSPATFRDGIFTTMYEFPTDAKQFRLPEGANELIIVAYDVANNRVESIFA